MAASLGITDTPEFRQAWLDGATLRQMAEMLGCSQVTIARKAKKFGYPPRHNPTKANKPVPKDTPQTHPQLRVVQVSDVGIYSGTVKKSPVSLPVEPWGSEAESVSERSLRAGWREAVQMMLAEGFGAEDIAIKLLCDPIDVRYEIKRLREAGKLASIYGVSANG